MFYTVFISLHHCNNYSYSFKLCISTNISAGVTGDPRGIQHVKFLWKITNPTLSLRIIFVACMRQRRIMKNKRKVKYFVKLTCSLQEKRDDERCFNLPETEEKRYRQSCYICTRLEVSTRGVSAKGLVLARRKSDTCNFTLLACWKTLLRQHSPEYCVQGRNRLSDVASYCLDDEIRLASASKCESTWRRGGRKREEVEFTFH